MEVASRALNEEPVHISDQVVNEAGPRKLKQRASGTFGNREWARVTHLLDRQGIVYRG